MAPILVPSQARGDRQGNVEAALLASAARTTTVQGTSADQTNAAARGVRVSLDVTANPGAGSLTLTIESKDPVSGVYTALLTGAAVTTNSHVEYVVYPSVAAVANLAVSSAIPRTWRVKVTHATADPYTYSVGASTIL